MNLKLNKIGWSEESKMSNYSMNDDERYAFPKMTEYTFV